MKSQYYYSLLKKCTSQNNPKKNREIVRDLKQWSSWYSDIREPILNLLLKKR